MKRLAGGIDGSPKLGSSFLTASALHSYVDICFVSPVLLADFPPMSAILTLLMRKSTSGLI
jgi:hypothetical protein